MVAVSWVCEGKEGRRDVSASSVSPCVYVVCGEDGEA